MRKVSLKVLFSTMLGMFIASMIPSIIQLTIGKSHSTDNGEINAKVVIFMIVFYLVLVFMFNFFMNKVIINRLKKLSDATKSVMMGNFNVEIRDRKKDEISDVINNFNQMVEALKHNEFLNKEFVRNFSHELKTPLSIVNGYADLLKDEQLSNKERLDYTTIINDEVIRLSNLSQNMLTISLVDSQIIIKRDDSFCVTEQIKKIIQSTQLSWEHKGLNLDLDLKKVEITSNKELLYHVWMNLFNNSVKFSSDNTTIYLKLFIEDDKLIFTIANDGVLDNEDIEKIFDLFYVANKSRNRQSSGIGLTLTKKILNKLGGDISVKSQMNQIIFKVILPINE